LRAELRQEARRLYRNHPDPGVHAAAGWLLGQWNAGPPPVSQSLEEAVARGARWYTTRGGHTLAMIRPAGEAASAGPSKPAGATVPPAPGEVGNKARSPAKVLPFAIALTEVTVEQFLRFRHDHPFNRDCAPERSCPVNDVTFFDAALYCNWLSIQEGLPPSECCYEVSVAKRPQDTKLLWASHDRLGYRLPTEAEWEYACRARTATSRFFGESSEYLRKYAWHYSNSEARSQPVGSLKPNPLGLFDVYGNVSEWCVRSWHEGHEDNEVLRGQSVRDVAGRHRSDARQDALRAFRHLTVGFRVARTLEGRFAGRLEASP